MNDPIEGDELAETPLESPYKLAALSQRDELNVQLREVQAAALNDPEY